MNFETRQVLLIIEDDETNLELTNFLASKGIQFLIANSGHKGINFWENLAVEIDLVIIDFDMADLPCQQIIKTLRLSSLSPKIAVSFKTEAKFFFGKVNQAGMIVMQPFVLSIKQN